ncbi:hypothetical protein GCM10023197_06650 [Gordonia humi]
MRAAGVIVVACAATGLVVGCGVDGTPVRAEGGAVVGGDGSNADPSRIPDLVLAPADFPSGYVAQEVPRGQMQEILDTLLRTTKTADVTPSHCLQLAAVPDSIDVDELGMVIATKGAESSLAESVMVAAVPVDEYRRQAGGDCAHLTMTMNVDGQRVDAESDQKIVAGPTTAASESLFVEQTTTSRVQSVTVTQRVLIGYAEVAGYTVSVQSTALTPSGRPDQAGFDALFVRAVDKVMEQA